MKKAGSKIRLVLLAVFVSGIWTACKKKEVHNGDGLMNYPDVEMIFRKNLQPFQQAPHTFKLLQIENGKRDSSFLKAKEVDWDDWKKPFLHANLYRKELDGHYAIDVITDTTYGKLTMLLSPLHTDEVTRTMSLTARLSDNRILSLYAETREAGFFLTREYKLLFVFRFTGVF